MYFVSKAFALAGATLLALSHAQAPSKSGEPILFGAGGTYPRAVRLADGSFLGVYADKRDGNSTLTTLKSTNNGASWDPLGIVTTRPSAGLDLDNPYVHQTPEGKILCAFRNHDFVTENGNRRYTHYRITVTISEDQGRTWKFQSQVEDYPAGADKNGSWEPFMQTGLDGSTQMYYSRENAGDDQDSILRRSIDNGKTWSAAQTISGADITARDGMLGVVPLSNQSPEKLAIFETVLPGGTFMVWTVRTPDDGQTWGERSEVYRNAGKNAGAPQIIRVGGKLVASFGVDEEGGAWPEGSLVVLISDDNGKTWKDKTTVHAVPALWGGMLSLDDKSFLVFYASGANTYAQKMVF